MDIYTEKKVSPVGQVNKSDLKKIARDTAIFFAAPILTYLAQLTGSLNQNGVVGISDLTPSLVTIGSVQGWFFGIVVNFFLKLSDGKK